MTVPANREIRASDGLIFKTNKAITLDNHRTASVRITCTSPGTAGNSAAAQTGQRLIKKTLKRMYADLSLQNDLIRNALSKK